MSKKFPIETLTRIAESIIGASEPAHLTSFRAVEVPDEEPNDVSFTNIDRGCKAARDLMESAADHTYDQWLVLGQLLSRTKNGRQLFHKVSARYPGYDAAEADQKFEEVRFRMKPPTCRRLEDVTAGASCRQCAFYGTVNSPYLLPHLPESVVEMMSDHVAVVNPPVFVHVLNGARYTERAFEQKFSHLAPKSRITTLFVKSKWAGKVERIVYRPGQATGILVEGEDRVLNIWRDTGIVPVLGDYGTIYEHLINLIGEPDEREHVLNYLAHLVQNPGAKIKHVMLIIGGQGIGKSAIGLLVKRILGADNIIEVGPSEAEGRFKARWGNRQFLIFEELMADDRLKFYNDLKEWITQDAVTVEEKHIQAYSAATPRGFLAFSNEQTPTRISPDDRRFFVVRSAMVPREPTYYDELFAAIDGAEAAAFKDHLVNRDIFEFKPDGRPPMTAAKRDLIDDTRPPVETRLEALIDDGLGVFAKDLVTGDAVRYLLHDYGDRKPSQAAVSTALRTLGHERYPTQVRLPDGARLRLWIIRNHERWRSADPEEVRQEISQQ